VPQGRWQRPGLTQDAGWACIDHGLVTHQSKGRRVKPQLRRILVVEGLASANAPLGCLVEDAKAAVGSLDDLTAACGALLVAMSGVSAA